VGVSNGTVDARFGVMTRPAKRKGVACAPYLLQQLPPVLGRLGQHDPAVAQVVEDLRSVEGGDRSWDGGMSVGWRAGNGSREQNRLKPFKTANIEKNMKGVSSQVTH
jgi:hypothetical protein